MSGEIRHSGGEYVDSGLRDVNGKPIEKWVRSSTEVKCCDEWVYCGGFTNTCPSCGTDYNMSGQQLAPRSQWGEDTGESLADILDIDSGWEYENR